MERGDIYLVSLDPAMGCEQQGTRPVFIISPHVFNIQTKAPVVFPITSQGRFAKSIGFAVSLEEAGLRTKGIIRTDQPRTLDLTARKSKFLEHAPMSITQEVMDRISTIFA
jgi:mRNA interferase ChpB